MFKRIFRILNEREQRKIELQLEALRPLIARARQDLTAVTKEGTPLEFAEKLKVVSRLVAREMTLAIRQRTLRKELAQLI